MIRHAALFTLNHPPGSPEEASFLAALADLASLPGVEAFQISREISPRNAFAFTVSMCFADQEAYDGYNQHPSHLAFVAERWLLEVASFMEHDTSPLI